ncbi:bifunctional DNA-formamidopyrimidine glycosylase/DNA-(apurinic or apyrimidinic site) lyase [Aquimonas voraii]|uniref:Formamidopyrimidine-DNA glycosylase n=1 Tax=Aquimonas voraii TaxID=265719 RepID=A0A1G6VES0_9GAMM|nr:bifunctional DNA-formamidopyrimidine glycosylase/DNA-(apurinic or apyrimidinic site) lyase [Aquimonas voraii]SDD51507.1 DNA-(apurinic or apyrimidinic site) lyase [Aquimonas voraii]
MPELPEVETTRRGIEPHLVQRRIARAVLRRPDLRWPIPPEITQELPGQRIEAVERRAKYLILRAETGDAILHLGMSGSLRVLPAGVPVRTHDHVDLELDDGQLLRFNDPRRFGALLWQARGQTHPLLAGLGPEPLSAEFSGEHLFRLSRGRAAPVKTFLMDQAIVVGVGNIYAAESLFRAGIDPRRAAGKVSLARYQALAEAVREILAYAIVRGGTTLRDFLAPDGAPGYFEQELLVYGREGQACKLCGTQLKHMALGQRATVWCPRCQR